MMATCTWPNCEHTAKGQCGNDELARLRAENTSLAAWQCVYTDGKTGLVGDEHGNQYCAMAKKVEALRAEVERLRAALKPLACTCAAESQDECSRSEKHCPFWNARAALGEKENPND